MSAPTSASTIMKVEACDLDTPGKRNKYTVSVEGLGRIGLPTACLFAEAGFRVIGTDSDQHVVSLLKKGKTPYIEPELSMLLKKHVKSGCLAFTTDNKKAATESDILMFALPSDVDGKKKPDYSQVEKACKEVGTELRRGSLVIFAGTTGPGITETLFQETLENASGLKAGIDFGLAHSPTRAAPGKILRDIGTYARVVGAINGQSFKVASLVLSTFVKGGIVRVHDVKTSEAVKLFENVHRDVNLALANDFALLCEKIGIDYLEAQEAANTQPYCHLLVPGIVSGHIPKDPYLLLEEAENIGAKLRLLELARKINDEMLEHTVQLVRDALRQGEKTLRRARITVLGVSYRANIKEPSGTKTKELVNMLTRKGAIVHVFDPLYSYNELKEMGYPAERTLTKTIEGADCLVILVGHTRFKRLSSRKTKFLMRKAAAIVDMGHIIDPVKAEREGFVYRGVGRGV